MPAIFKALFTLLLIACFHSASAQFDHSWIPFRLHIVDGKDTIHNFSDFYLGSADRQFCPAFNDSLKCFEFRDVDSVVDFHVLYKGRELWFRKLDPLILSQDEWFVPFDLKSNDSTFQLVTDRRQDGPCNFFVSFGTTNPVIIQKKRFRISPPIPRDYTIYPGKRQLKSETKITLHFEDYSRLPVCRDTFMTHYDPDGYETGLEPEYPNFRDSARKLEIIKPGKRVYHKKLTLYSTNNGEVNAFVNESISEEVRRTPGAFEYPNRYSVNWMLADCFKKKMLRKQFITYSLSNPGLFRRDTTFELNFLFWSWTKKVRKEKSNWASYNHISRWSKSLKYNDSLKAWFVDDAAQWNRQSTRWTNIHTSYLEWMRDFSSTKRVIWYDNNLQRIREQFLNEGWALQYEYFYFYEYYKPE